MIQSSFAGEIVPLRFASYMAGLPLIRIRKFRGPRWHGHGASPLRFLLGEQKDPYGEYP
jgi:hypothetical protein